VQQVDDTGTITEAQALGTAPLFSSGQSWINLVGTNITGTGTDATWDIESVPGTATVFDGGAMQFIDPVDGYSNTQAFDKYLVFPYRTILGQ